MDRYLRTAICNGLDERHFPDKEIAVINIVIVPLLSMRLQFR